MVEHKIMAYGSNNLFYCSSCSAKLNNDECFDDISFFGVSSVYKTTLILEPT
jgi:hypothetical protein